MDELERIGITAGKVRDDLTPTRKQLTYLSSLAYSRRSTFEVPVTRTQAHEEIERLLGEPKARAARRRRIRS